MASKDALRVSAEGCTIVVVVDIAEGDILVSSF